MKKPSNSVLDRKPMVSDGPISLLLSIQKLAADKRSRVLVSDQCEWLETKMKEIARIARLAIRALKNDGGRVN